jgi:hypothetical protein
LVSREPVQVCFALYAIETKQKRLSRVLTEIGNRCRIGNPSNEEILHEDENLDIHW